MPSRHLNPKSPKPLPSAGNAAPERADLEPASNAEKPEAMAEHVPEDTSLDGIAEEYHDFALSLRGCDWDQLQRKFGEAMDQRSQAENALQKETAELLEMFISWSQTTIFRDEDRAYKRFKTRMGFAQNSEAKLEEKKKHYANVVKAFENALALLRVD
ncbi:hypothetical protein AJ79_08825 [Helicocarpus griseus UAMH5409]|uniref:Uncharacterized protein n=1 Tax=Helicocarpus griseus UAMH5409 TaxID=1447875 RepID=A0A2B7WPM7_9EURO|nr:hypothetical protein AJ79_08825 [Helicocarpus griseus UAMH5409]